MKNKGFTLIELLVVIAIIGILSSVVLASLNSARSKGADAAVKGNIAGIRAQAELYYDDSTKGNQSYGVSATNCTTGIFLDQNIANAINAANAQKGTGTTLCFASSTAWAVSVPLKGETGKWYCVSSDGVATTTSVAAAISASDSSCN